MTPRELAHHRVGHDRERGDGDLGDRIGEGPHVATRTPPLGGALRRAPYAQRSLLGVPVGTAARSVRRPAWSPDHSPARPNPRCRVGSAAATRAPPSPPLRLLPGENPNSLGWSPGARRIRHAPLHDLIAHRSPDQRPEGLEGRLRRSRRRAPEGGGAGRVGARPPRRRVDPGDRPRLRLRSRGPRPSSTTCTNKVWKDQPILAVPPEVVLREPLHA